MKLRKEDKQLWVENKVIEFINCGRSKSDAKHMAEEIWEDIITAEDIVGDLADNDEFECVRCHGIFDIEDSIKIDGNLYCPRCSGDSKVLR